MAYYTMLWKDEKSKISDLLDCIECRKIRLDEFGRPDGFQFKRRGNSVHCVRSSKLKVPIYR